MLLRFVTDTTRVSGFSDSDSISSNAVVGTFGVRIGPSAQGWRWDEARQDVTMASSATLLVAGGRGRVVRDEFAKKRRTSAAVSAQASAFPYKASRRLHARSAAGSL
jgi:hypothetical protein